MDGLVCVIHNEFSLTIHQLGESKVGTSSPKRDQAQRFLSTVATNGLKIGEYAFLPEDIRLQWNDEPIALFEAIQKDADSLNRQSVVMLADVPTRAERWGLLLKSPLSLDSLNQLVDHIFAAPLSPLNRQRLVELFLDQRYLAIAIKLKELNFFIETKGNWPNGNHKDENREINSEAMLGRWVSKNGGQVELYPKLNAKAQAVLDAIYVPTLEKLNEWIEMRGTWPNSDRKDENGKPSAEGKLGWWVANNGGQEGLYPNLSAKARANFGPFYARSSLEKLITWIEENGSWPYSERKDVNGKRNEEGRLGNWVAKNGGQVGLYPHLSAKAQAVLDAIYVRPPLEMLVVWIEKNGSWPSSDHRDENGKLDEEGQLAKWVGNNGGRVSLYPKLSKQAQALLDAIFVPSLDKLNRWIEANGAWPKQIRKDENGQTNDEGKLGAWVRNNGGQIVFYPKLSVKAQRNLQESGWKLKQTSTSGCEVIQELLTQ